MAHDVVECPHRLIDIEDRASPEVQVLQAERGHDLPACVDLACGEVDADPFRVRHRLGERKEVAPRAAAQFEDTAAFDGSGLETEQTGERRQRIGMSPRPRPGVVDDFVVARQTGGGHEGSCEGGDGICLPVNSAKSRWINSGPV